MPVDWTAPGEMFPRLIMLLLLPLFRRDALAGLCVSVGGLTESLVCFLDYFVNNIPFFILYYLFFCSEFFVISDCD
jgi:hypothetical protein